MRFFSILLPLVAMLGLAGGPVGGPPWQTEAVAVRSSPPSDTLFFRLRAGDPFLTTLPRQHEGRPVQYTVLRAPSLAWVVDASVYLRTLPQQRGIQEIRLLRAPGDTLLLRIETYE